MRRPLIAVLALLAGVIGSLVPAAAQAQNRFWLVNESGRVIQSAYVSPSRLSDWGPDILGTSVLTAGNRVWVTPNFGDCVLDVRVSYQGGGEDTRMQVNACTISQISFGRGSGAGAAAGGGAGAVVTPGRPAAQGNPSFVLTNGTGLVIREVYASMSTQSSYGGDRLGANVLQPGARLQVSLPTGMGCLTDVRVVYMDGRAAERRGIETCSLNELVWR